MKFTKNVISVILLIFTICLICCFSIFNYTQTASANFVNGETKKVPIYEVSRQDNKISISFDCAYGADYTDKILEILDNYNVKCTFFVVEFWVKKFPDKVAKIIECGHEIGTHSSTHPYMSKLTKDGIKNQLTSSISAIETITNQKVTLFRPPYGDYNNAVIETANELNLKTMLIRSLDT